MLLLILPLLLSAADDKKAGAKTPKPAPAAATKTSQPGLPAGAKSIGPETWRYTDAQGKNWIYRKTPFGVSRSSADEKPAVQELPANLKATQVGDEIKFERPSPFGVTSWTRKMDEMSDLERRIWERDRPKPVEPAKSADAKTANKE